MRDILITSSALILVLLLLRQVFRKTISRRLQYGLWALVLVRLLVPGSLLDTPFARFSVLTAAAPVTQAVEERVGQQSFYSRPMAQMTPERLLTYNLTVEEVPTYTDNFSMILALPDADPASQAPPRQGYLVRDAETGAVTLYEHAAIGPWEALALVWKVGMGAMALFFLGSNLLFWQKLRKARRAYTPDPELFKTQRGVYLVPDGVIPSPCLFGNAIYLTPAAVETPTKLRHVLTHEETHARHWDPLWALLRCVCLTVYWFDPLVWAAAACARTDCELACDESALLALGENERIGYGETLLSLIPVRRGNPLLSATTMTAGKRQLKDRITRIAQRPKQLTAAVLAVAVLAAVAAACTFTKGGPVLPADTPAPAETLSPTGEVPLPGEELRWFNEQFFNSAATGEGGDPYYTGGENAGSCWYNIRNQFANPSILYDRPEDIDLNELFYLEGSAPSDEEVRRVFGMEPGELPCMAYKATAAELSDLLSEYTGLTLAEANRDSLTFQYDPAADAYYWMHGDTNYCGELCFLYGTHDGGTMHLYHTSGFAGGGWYRVTLEMQEDGSYRFLSNQACDHPAIPPVIPAKALGNKAALKAAAYTAPGLTVENRPAAGFPTSWPNSRDNWNFDGHHVRSGLMDDGLVRAAVEREDGTLDVFLTVAEEAYQGMFFYNDLFGHDGFYVDYTPNGLPTRDFYYFDSNDALTLLLRADCWSRGGCYTSDVNGDGTDELLTDKGDLFFQKDGQLYFVSREDLGKALLSFDPRLERVDNCDFDLYGRYWRFTGNRWDEEKGGVTWTRRAYFDGDALLIYDPAADKVAVDHVVWGSIPMAPLPVAEAAKAYVLGQLEALPDGGWINAADAVYRASEDRQEVVFDDWRIEAFYGPWIDQLEGVRIESWAFNYELHTQTPAKVVQAGGRYVTEDGWVSPGYPGCDYLFFGVSGPIGDRYRLLWHEVNNDMAPHSDAWKDNVERRAAELGYEVGASAAARQIQADLDWFYDQGEVFLDLQGFHPESFHPESEAGVTRLKVDLAELYNGRDRRKGFTDPALYRWSREFQSANVPDLSVAPSLTIVSGWDWDRYLRFYEGSDYVLSVKPGEGGTWYKAESLTGPSDACRIFSYMRQIYDEAELSFVRGRRLQYTDPVTMSVPGERYSPEAWAAAWADNWEEANLFLSSGSAYAFSWQRVPEAEILTQTDDSMSILYTLAFTPENDRSERQCRVGNTGLFSDYPSPKAEWDVPEDALFYTRVLRLEKRDDRWTAVSCGIA